jgi:hypothetical protein
MNFSVNATALPGLAQLMDRRRQDLTDGRDYLAHNARVERGQAGILNWLWGQHEKIVRATADFLARAADGYAAPYAMAIVEAARTTSTAMHGPPHGWTPPSLARTIPASTPPAPHGPTRP